MRAADSPHWNANPPTDPLGDFFQRAYVVTSAVIGGATFLGGWAYCVMTYGFFLGVSLGWIPAGILGSIAFIAWPLVVLAACFVLPHVWR